jgi:hypothetical protein
MAMGSEMPKKKKKDTSFNIGIVLLVFSALLLFWLILKTLKLVDPPEDFTTYILEAILGLMLSAQFAEALSFRKKIESHGEAIIEIKTKIEYIEKSIEELKTNLKIRDEK